MSTIIINGNTFTVEGSNVSIINGVVTCGGTTITTISGNAHITWDGPLASLRTDSSVTCGDVSGNVDAAGSVKADNINGNATAGGNIKASSRLGGSIRAGGSVNIG